MLCKKAQISAPLSGQIAGQVSRPARRANAVSKCDIVIQESVQDRCIIGALHPATFHNQSDFHL